MANRPRVLFVVPRLDSNHMYRLRSLALLCDAIDWDWHVAGRSLEGGLWGPLSANSRWVEQTTIIDGSWQALLPLAQSAQVVVACKPLPRCLFPARKAARRAKRPLLIDLDDPDFDVWRALYNDPEWQRKRSWFKRQRVLAELAYAEYLTRRSPKVVSTPILQERYGGDVLPHATEDCGPGARHLQKVPTIGFIGTPREHKGIELLRSAVATIRESHPMRLIITGDAPFDAHPWEEWCGAVSLEEANRLTAGCDVVAVPSLDIGYAKAQLPAKLLSAMMCGRAIIASDLPPVRWALGETGLLVKPGNVEALSDALIKLYDPSLRQKLGDEARRRALREYTPQACMQVLREKFKAASMNKLNKNG